MTDARDDNNYAKSGVVVRKLFWTVFACLLLIAAILYLLSILDIPLAVRGVTEKLAMVTLGAALATLIHESLLREYYKEQLRRTLAESLTPDFDGVKKKVDDAMVQIVSAVTTQTTESIDDIRKRVAEASDFMLNGISVLQGAKSSGIVNIFPTRYNDISRVESVKATIVTDITSETNLIRLMGISLGDYFLDRGILHSTFAELLDSAHRKDGHPRIKALLVHPKCEALRERARWEAGPEYRDPPAFYDSTTFIETDGAARIAKRLGEKFPSLEVRLYSQAPTVFILLTSRFAFFEPYTYSSRGSKVPLIQVQAEVALYQHLANHFTRIWDVSEPISRFDSIRGQWDVRIEDAEQRNRGDGL